MTEIEEKIVLLKKIITEITKERDKKINEVNNLLNEILPLCQHSEIETNEKYISGGYYEREEYITTHSCKFCGKKIDEQKKYGGYG